jgi:uncharacterized Zn finger protein
MMAKARASGSLVNDISIVVMPCAHCSAQRQFKPEVARAYVYGRHDGHKVQVIYKCLTCGEAVFREHKRFNSKGRNFKVPEFGLMGWL